MEQIKEHYEKNNVKGFFMSTKYLIKLNNLDFFGSIEPSKLFSKSILVDYYLRTSQENQIFILAMLRDKAHQLYKEETLEFEDHYAKAVRLGEKSSIAFDQSLLKLIWNKNLNFLENHALSIQKFLEELPGFCKLSSLDQRKIINEQFFTILSIRTLKLFKNDEYYFMLDDETWLSKRVMQHLMGYNACEKIFSLQFKLQSFEFTDQELALLITIILSIQSSSKNKFYKNLQKKKTKNFF